MHTDNISDSFIPPANDKSQFTIEDLLALKSYNQQLLFLSNALKDIIVKYL